MPLYLIAGVTGSGKSTVREALSKLNCEAYDTDDGDIATYYDKVTNKAVNRPKAVSERTEAWYAQHEWRLNKPALDKLAERAKTKPVFLCGVTVDIDNFKTKFSKIFCLTLGWDQLEQRILTRTNNEFGKAPDELRSVRSWHYGYEEQQEKQGAIMINASQPVEQIVQQILSAV